MPPPTTGIPRVAKQGVGAAPPRLPQAAKVAAKCPAKVVAKVPASATSALSSRIAQPPATRGARQVPVVHAAAARRDVAARPAAAPPSTRGTANECKRTLSKRSTAAMSCVAASVASKTMVGTANRSMVMSSAAAPARTAPTAPRTALKRPAASTATSTAISTTARPTLRSAAPRTLPSVVGVQSKPKAAASHPPQPQPREAATAASSSARACLPSSSATLPAPALGSPVAVVSPLRVIAVSPCVRAPAAAAKCRRASLNGTVYYPGTVSWSEQDDTVVSDMDSTLLDVDCTVLDDAEAFVDPKGRNVDDFLRTGRWPVTPPAELSRPLPDPMKDATEYTRALKMREMAMLRNRVRLLDGLADRFRACIEFRYQGTIAGRRMAREPTWLKDLVTESPRKGVADSPARTLTPARSLNPSSSNNNSSSNNSSSSSSNKSSSSCSS